VGAQHLHARAFIRWWLGFASGKDNATGDVRIRYAVVVHEKPMSFPKSPRIELPKLRKAAQGSECMLQLPGVCNRNPATTVLAHRDRAGMGMKQHDFRAMNLCSSCHDVYDMRVPSEFSLRQLRMMFDDVWPRQIEWWFRNGFLK
jgi:hypothetical protein